MTKLTIDDFKIGDKVKLFNYNVTVDGVDLMAYSDQTAVVTQVLFVGAGWVYIKWPDGKIDTLFANTYGYDVLSLQDAYKLEDKPKPTAPTWTANIPSLNAAMYGANGSSIFTEQMSYDEYTNDKPDKTTEGTVKKKMPRTKKIKKLKAEDFYVGQKIMLSDYEGAFDAVAGQVATVLEEPDSVYDVRIEWPSSGKGWLFSIEDYRGAYEVDDNGEPLGSKKAKKTKKASQASAPVDPTPISTDFMRIIASVDQAVSQRINDSVGDQLNELTERVEKALNDADKTKRLEVVTDTTNVILDGIQHKEFEKLLKIAQLRQNALLVGMAGTGKTHAGSQVAEALNLPFYTMSVGAQTSKSDIIGYMSATGDYIRTHFREAYENGGIFLMDEIDAGNANVLIQVNAALSNGVMSFPDLMINRHKDFIFIASANTYGTGMNRQYVGRNQLDAATLDRFTTVDWDVDDDLEEMLAGDNGKWLMAVRGAREFVNQHNIRALITPRATQKGSSLLANGFNVEDVISSVMLGSVPEDRKADLMKHAKSIYEN